MTFHFHMIKSSSHQALALKVLWGALVGSLALSIVLPVADAQKTKGSASMNTSQRLAQNALPAAPAALSGSAISVGKALAPGDANYPPAVPREFRAAWVATVEQIDWPSKAGLSADAQRQEATAILDRAAQLKLNAIVLQVRPMADAFFKSGDEPWSQFLSGWGVDPGYDPLEFWTTEAHRRGIELHAWFNPYRAGKSADVANIPANHISKRHPDYVMTYGKYLWLDPGHPEVSTYVRALILDVVRRYDIDAVHFDDYFYPYVEQDANKQPIPFPDDATYNDYVKRNPQNPLSRGDWRVENVNTLVRGLYSDIKAVKPQVKLGISPFGIWRPGNPPGIKGMDAVATLNADAKRWLQEGWLDYITPQLYWTIAKPDQSFPVLLKWWAEQNTKNRHLWPGMAPYRVGTAPNNYPAQEMVDQIAITRRQPGASGHVMFSWKSLQNNLGGVSDLLAKDTWAQPALVPASPWLDAKAPAAPRVQSTLTGEVGVRGMLRVTWQPGDAETPWLWVVQTKGNGPWLNQILPGETREIASMMINNNAPPKVVAVSAVDRSGNQSAPVAIVIP